MYRNCMNIHIVYVSKLFTYTHFASEKFLLTQFLIIYHIVYLFTISIVPM